MTVAHRQGHGPGHDPGHGHGHGPAHSHGHGGGRGHGQAPEAPTGVMAYLNGEQIPRALLDERLAALRAGDAACVLPRPDSREGRQLARWVAQVVVTEQICYDELHRRGIPAATHTSSTPTTSGNPSSTRTSSADAASTHPSSGSTSRGSASSTADTSSARAAFTRTAAADQVLDVSTAIAVG